MQFVDSDHPDVVAFAEEATAGATTDREKAVALFYAVRDRIRYDPYVISSNDPEAYRASRVLRDGVSYCIPKSVLLCAAARAVGLTARLGFADVRNHLNSPKLRERLGGSDLFVWHGYTEFLLNGRWVKVTSAGIVEKAIPLDVSDPVLLGYLRRAMSTWAFRPAQANGACGQHPPHAAQANGLDPMLSSYD